MLVPVPTAFTPALSPLLPIGLAFQSKWRHLGLPRALTLGSDAMLTRRLGLGVTGWAGRFSAARAKVKRLDDAFGVAHQNQTRAR